MIDEKREDFVASEYYRELLELAKQLSTYDYS